MALSTIPFSALSADASNQGVNFRNLIINGDMSIAQRGTSTSSVTSSGYFACDRWHVNLGSLGTWTVAQETLTSGDAYTAGFTKAFRLDCTTADASPAVSDSLWVRQKFEGQMLRSLKKGTANAEQLTVSFWVKSNKTGTYSCGFYDHETTPKRHVYKNYTISSANTWEKKTLTFPADTSGTMGDVNTVSLDIRWVLGAGSNYTGGTQATTAWEDYTQANVLPNDHVNLADSTANDWSITGVQLEVGTTASDFEFLPYDVNFKRCLRYFEKSFNQGVTPASNIITNVLFGRRGIIYFKETKRTNPTMTSYASLGSNSTWHWYSGVFNSVTPIFGVSNNLFSYDLGGYEYTDVYGNWTADAEL